jgi:hypothetical protein
VAYTPLAAIIRYRISQRVALALTHTKCVEHAAAAGSVVVPEETSVFTVKLPSTLVARVRGSVAIISALVAQALTGHLAAASGSVRAGERSGGSHRVRVRPKISTALFRICPKD